MGMKLEIFIKEIDGDSYLCLKLADLSKLRAKRFTPPTIEEVRAYCKERGNKVNAQQYMNHYESNGWLVGKNKMKSWQAAVRTWELSDIDKKPEGFQRTSENAPAGYGVFSKDVTPMPASLKKRVLNIGEEP